MISRRQFFGKVAIGAVGVATVPFIPWDKLVKLFTKPVPRYIPLEPEMAAEWRKIWSGTAVQDNIVWDSISNGRKAMLAPASCSTQEEYEMAWENELDKVFVDDRLRN